MRTLGIVALLLFMVAAAHGPVVAAENALTEAAVSDSDGINPICVQAFAIAEAAASSASTTTPADDRLDGTIRACGSLMEWTVGALLHPGAVGEAEAIGLLDDRCSHPATQLEAYATCRSLQAALADAQPDTGDLADATDTEQTPTVAAATASEPPARSPTAAARPVNQSIPVPGPDGRVKLPRKLRAEVPGATRVQYFSVAGRSASALVTQTLRRAAPHCGVHNALACVNLTWHVETTQHTEAGACTVVDATSAVSSVVHLPRWTKPKRVDAELLTWWRRVLADSARHEARHIRILQKELTQLRKRLVGRPCSSVDRLIDRARQRANKSQAVFDRRESAKPLPPAP